MDKQTERVIERTWSKETIMQVELGIVQNMLGSRTEEAVEGSISFARFLSLSGLNNDNYPLFLKLLEVENHWVIDTMVAKKDPFLLLSAIQPNSYLSFTAFKLLTNWHPGGIYPVTLSVVLGMLQGCFASAKDGFKIYSVSINDVNNLGKHLDKEKNQMDPLNRTVLTVLDEIAGLIEPQKPIPTSEVKDVALQANNIRGKFLDMTKRLNEAIPDILLERGDYTKTEIRPNVAKIEV